MKTEQFGAFPALEDQSTEAGLAIIIRAQADALSRLAKQTQGLATVIDAAVTRLRGTHGRLVYVGAGASGRIAVQDGVELWPTLAVDRARALLAQSGGSVKVAACLNTGLSLSEVDSRLRLAQGRLAGIID
ncbi:hypothetical protein GH975_07880 [Litorivicinus lipolyticus]|uniref:N-acetylmuramic acid 6-phosphate etherase n=1 Tax=Litorivicinus lipolyticus TaxID=418701 RepID=A0A5Q2QHI9_9GAMM|nr:hypothetical protein [Litorivicinus lipolyticus]QGG80495.1 hypothetical protein GH975_07880 [Litorivicinus lipolyticus]